MAGAEYSRPNPFGPDPIGTEFKGQWIYGQVEHKGSLYLPFAGPKLSGQPQLWKYTV